MELIIDIETIPSQNANELDNIKESIEVKVPSDLTKPKLMTALGTNDKFKTVAELKEMWLETFGEQRKDEQAKEALSKTALDGSKGEIVCICFCNLNGDMVSIYRGEGESEKAMLEQFWDAVNNITQNQAPFFIAHNAKFDLPFILHRSIINNVKPNSFFKAHGRHGNDHYCTMEAWAGFGGRIGLDRLASALGEQGKIEGFSGAEVYPAWKRGDLSDIVSYCEQDVTVTKNIYKRIKFL